MAPATSDANKNEQKTASDGIENPAFVADSNQLQMSQLPNKVNETTEEITKKGFFREFFDPKLVMESVEVVFKKREGNLRFMLFLILICNFLFVGHVLGESDLIYLYTRLKINWSGVEYSWYLTYATSLALGGTLLMVGVFSKFLGVTDAMIGIVATIFTLISKPFFVSYAI